MLSGGIGMPILPASWARRALNSKKSCITFVWLQSLQCGARRKRNSWMGADGAKGARQGRPPRESTYAAISPPCSRRKFE